MKEKIKLAVGLIILIVCVTISIVLKLKNIDMTDMRLLITYWKEYIVLIIFIFISGFLCTSALNEIE